MLPASEPAQAGQVAIGDLIVLEALAQNVQVVLRIPARPWDRPNIDELSYVGRWQKPHKILDSEGGVSYGEKWIVQTRATVGL